MKKQTLFPFLLILASADAFSTSSTRPTLALLTFDLDDTLFPCGPVVAEANEAMIASIVSHGYPSVTNEDVLAATKAIRNELRKTDTPITYTNLRIAAIQSQLERSLALHNPDLGSNALHESVSAHPEDFRALAQKHSQGPFARRGGELGFMTSDGKPGVEPEVVKSRAPTRQRPCGNPPLEPSDRPNRTNWTPPASRTILPSLCAS